MFKQFSTFLYIVCLILNVNAEAIAQTDDKFESREDLFNLQNMMLRGPLKAELLPLYSAQVVERVDKKFSENPKDPYWNTETGKATIGNHKLLINYIALQKQLERCLKADPPEKAKTIMNTLGAVALRSVGDISPCDVRVLDSNLSGLDQIQRLHDFMQGSKESLAEHLGDKSADLKNATSDLQSFASSVLDHSLLNGVKSLFALRYRYEPDFFVQKEKTPDYSKKIKDFVEDYCRPQSNFRCSPAQKKLLSTQLEVDARETFIFGSKTDFESTRVHLNQIIQELNKPIANKRYASDGSSVALGDYPDEPTKQQAVAQLKADHQEYTRRFEEMTTKGTAVLMHTLDVRKGGYRPLTADSFARKDRLKGKIGFNNHHNVETAEEVKQAYLKAVEGVKKHAEDTFVKNNLIMTSEDKMLRGSTSVLSVISSTERSVAHHELELKTHLKDLTRMNPVAVAQSLLLHPERTGLVCELARQIDQDHKDQLWWDRNYVIGGIAIGVGTIISGGALGLAYLGTYGLAGAGTFIAGAAATTFAAGTVLSAGHAAWGGVRLYNKARDYDELEAAVVSGNASEEMLKDRAQAYISLKKATMDLALDTGFVALDLGALKALGVLGDAVSPALKITRMNALAGFLKTTAKDSRIYKNMLTALSGGAKITKPAVDKLRTLLAYIGSLSGKGFEKYLTARDKFLKAVAEGGISPERLSSFIERLLDKGKKCI